jgi:hypothetical protein
MNPSKSGSSPRSGLEHLVELGEHVLHAGMSSGVMFCIGADIWSTLLHELLAELVHELLELAAASDDVKS